MPTEEFKGDTLGEVQQALERWKHDHPGVIITKVTPVEFVYGGAHFLGTEQGPGQVIGAAIVIDYEVRKQVCDTPSVGENVQTDRSAQPKRNKVRRLRLRDWKFWFLDRGLFYLIGLITIGIWIFTGVNPYWQLVFLFYGLFELVTHVAIAILHLFR